MRATVILSGALLLLAGMTLAQEATQEARPRLSLDDGGRLVLSDLPAVLGEEEVRRHLDSGLTASFVFQARLERPKRPGGARIDIRFELWDEVYLVTVIDGGGGIESLRHDSIEALIDWWSSVALVLTEPSAAAIAAPARAKVSLAVVPFSQTELDDTQRWLTESIGQVQGGSRTGREGGGSQAVGALIATSMQRRAVRSMNWNLPIARRGGR